MIKKFIKGALGLLGILVLCFVLLPTGQVSAADGDPYYWAGNSGNWSDVAHWSSTDDGTGGDYATPPNATNDVFFSTNAFTLAGQTVTVDIDPDIKSLSFVGVTNTPTLTLAGFLDVYGDITFSANMVVTNSAYNLTVKAASNVTTNGLDIKCVLTVGTGGNLVLADDFTSSTRGIAFANDGIFNTNGKTVNAKGLNGFNTATLTLGSSTLNITGAITILATNTLTANTSTINCSGAFSGGSLVTYNVVNLTGATSTITGSNTFNSLAFTRAGVQTITFTDGTVQTVSMLARDFGSSLKTLQGSGVAGWGITISDGSVRYNDNFSISRSTASPAGGLIAGANSINGGNNVDWVWVADSTTGAETNVTTGAATLNGTVTTNGTNTDRRGFQYGTVSGALNLDVHSDGSYATGAYSFDIVGLDQNDTYYYRAYAVTAGVTEYGVEGSLNTQPTAWGIMMLLPLMVAIGVVIIGLRAFSSAGMQGYMVSVLFGIATYIMLQALIGIL